MSDWIYLGQISGYQFRYLGTELEEAAKGDPFARKYPSEIGEGQNEYKGSITLFGDKYYDDMKRTFLRLEGSNLGPAKTSLALELEHMGYGTFKGYDPENNPTTKFSPYAFGAGVAGSRFWTVKDHFLAAGLRFTHVQETDNYSWLYPDESKDEKGLYQNNLLDLSGNYVWRNPSAPLSVKLGLFDLPLSSTEINGIAPTRFSYDLEVAPKIGQSVALVPALGGYFGQDIRFHAGLGLKGDVGGVSFLIGGGWNNITGITFGGNLEVKPANLSLGVAYTGDPLGSNSIKLSLTYRFGKVKKEEKPAEEVKKPVEEVKKPVEETKKIEETSPPGKVEFSFGFGRAEFQISAALREIVDKLKTHPDWIIEVSVDKETATKIIPGGMQEVTKQYWLLADKTTKVYSKPKGLKAAGSTGPFTEKVKVKKPDQPVEGLATAEKLLGDRMEAIEQALNLAGIVPSRIRFKESGKTGKSATFTVIIPSSK